jgi:chromosome partitioning protein
MKILAAYNIKGGVGKTAAAVNLSYLAAREGARTLVWDLDPQSAATYYFRIRPKVKGGGKKLLHNKRELNELIKGTDYDHLDLLPADFSYRNMDLVLEETKKSTSRLRRLLKPLADEYDYVFLDCPPSISLVSENVFRAADALLIPTIPTTLSLRTLDQLIRFCAGNDDLSDLKLMPFFSMVDRRKQLHRIITESPPKTLSGLLQTRIPYASDVERMGTRRAALGSYAGKSPSALAYESLWREIKRQLP